MSKVILVTITSWFKERGGHRTKVQLVPILSEVLCSTGIGIPNHKQTYYI